MLAVYKIVSQWRGKLRRRYVLAIIANLAIGIAGVTSVWSVWRGTLGSRGLRADDRRVFLMGEYPEMSLRMAPGATVFRAWDGHLTSFELLAGIAVKDGVLRTDRGGQRIHRGLVTPRLLELAGLTPIVGRSFDEDDSQGPEPIALLSYRRAALLFGEPEAALGKSLTVDGTSLVVVGVLPPRFEASLLPGERIDVMSPLGPAEETALQVFARLREDVSREQAQAELAAWSRHQPAETTEERPTWVVLPSSELADTRSRETIRAAVLGGLLLLIVTISNVGHLQAAQSASQRRDLATRWALGASRWSLLRWRWREAVVVTALAACLAGLLTRGALAAMVATLPESLRLLEAVRFDLEAFAFASALCLLIVLVTGMFVVLLARPQNLADELRVMKEGLGRSSRWGRILGDLHVVTMIAASLVLAVASYLVIGTIVALGKVEHGFEARGLHRALVELPQWRYPEPAHRADFFATLMQRLAAMPGGSSLALASFPPPEPAVAPGALRFDDQGEEQRVTVDLTYVREGYFRVMEQEILSGRDVLAEDVATRAAVVVISESVARMRGLEPSAAVGQTLQFGAKQLEVIGVVRDIRTPRRRDGGPHVYMPLTDFRPSTAVLVRTSEARSGDLFRTIRSLDPDLALEVSTMEDLLIGAAPDARFLTVLFSFLALLAIGLAVGGVYAMLSSFAVKHRSQIAVRMAVGARRSEVSRFMVWKGVSKGLSGTALGVVLSYPFSRLIANHLFGLTPGSTPARVAAVLLILAVTVAASWLPALRASRIDPNEVLRDL